jgi:shikimate kinase
LEEKIVLKTLQNKNSIVSLGGGAFFNEKIRKEIIMNHISFWLNCNNKTLLNRIRKNKKRPLANKLTNSELIELINKRKKIYTKANFKINCDKLSKEQIVESILNSYETI